MQFKIKSTLRNKVYAAQTIQLVQQKAKHSGNHNMILHKRYRAHSTIPNVKFFLSFNKQNYKNGQIGFKNIY